MSDEAWKLFVSVIAFVGLVFGIVAFQNANEVERCASLRRQGVKVYVSEGIASKKCEVLERDMVGR